MKTNRRRYPFLGPLLLVPTTAFANGVSPILNFFHKDTSIPASVVTLVIILVETALMRWRIKSQRFTSTVWRCFVFNVASSPTGSILLLGLSGGLFLWDTMILVLPLFLITLLTEISTNSCKLVISAFGGTPAFAEFGEPALSRFLPLPSAGPSTSV